MAGRTGVEGGPVGDSKPCWSCLTYAPGSTGGPHNGQSRPLGWGVLTRIETIAAMMLKTGSGVRYQAKYALHSKLFVASTPLPAQNILQLQIQRVGGQKSRAFVNHVRAAGQGAWLVFAAPSMERKTVEAAHMVIERHCSARKGAGRTARYSLILCLVFAGRGRIA